MACPMPTHSAVCAASVSQIFLGMGVGVLGAFGVPGLRTRWQILNDQSPHEHDEAVSGSLFISQAKAFSLQRRCPFTMLSRKSVAADQRFSNPDFRRFPQLHRRTL